MNLSNLRIFSFINFKTEINTFGLFEKVNTVASCILMNAEQFYVFIEIKNKMEIREFPYDLGISDTQLMKKKIKQELIISNKNTSQEKF